MKRIERPEAVRALIDRYSIRGAFDLRLEEALLPVCLVDDLTSGQETSPRPAWGGRGGVGASGAGNQWVFSVRNAPNSGVLIEVEQLVVITAAPDTFDLRFDTSSADALAFESWRDRRLPGNPVGRVRAPVAAASAVVVPPLLHTDTTPLTSYVPGGLGIILPPNTMLEVRQATINSTITSLQAFWTETDI